MYMYDVLDGGNNFDFLDGASRFAAAFAFDFDLRSASVVRADRVHAGIYEVPCIFEIGLVCSIFTQRAARSTQRPVSA